MTLLNRLRPGPKLTYGGAHNDPRIQAVLDELGRADLDPAQRIEGALRYLGSVRDDPERQTTFLCHLPDVANSLDDVARDQAVSAAASGLRTPEEVADGFALAAMLGVSAAWAIRSSRRAKYVRADAWKPFHAMLQTADDLALEGLVTAPGHPGAAQVRMFSALGLGVPEQEWWSRFEQTRDRRPTIYAGHASMLTSMTQKWYGSHGVMFDFARGLAETAPLGDPVGALIGSAHYEYRHSDDRKGMPSPEAQVRADAARITRVSDGLLDAGDALFEHPQAWTAHQWMATLTTGSRQTQHLRRSGRRITGDMWWESRAMQFFRAAMRGAGIRD